jgi:hypothetical protein
MNPNSTTGPSAQPRNEKGNLAGRGAICPLQLDQADEDTLRMAANAAVAKAAAAAGPAFKERRRSVRFQCSGTVDFQAEGSDVRLSGSLTDVSLHGCYVEMPTTFPIDTLVTLNIEARGIRFHTRAKVRATYPFVGVGMRFEEMELGQQAQLTQLLRSITAERTLLNLPSIEHPNPPDVVASADPSACLEAISNFFQRNTSLSRDEFLAIAKRVRRS